MNDRLKNLIAILFLFCFATFAQAQTPPSTAPSGEGLVPMFNGKDFSGWKEPSPNIWWKYVDGMIVGENDPTRHGNDLYTEKSYKDFEFEMEFRYEGEVDTGVFLRKPLIQVQIGISRSLHKDKTGSLYQEGTGGGYVGNASGVENVLKTGDWNKLHFIAKGDNLKVWLNDIQVLDCSIAKYAEPAPIGLQIHGGVKMKVEFRNVKFRDLDAPAAQ